MRTELDIDDDLTTKQLNRLLQKPDVRRAMRLRCEHEGHEYQPGIALGMSSAGPTMRVRRTCRWCCQTD